MIRTAQIGLLSLGCFALAAHSAPLFSGLPTAPAQASAPFREAFQTILEGRAHLNAKLPPSSRLCQKGAEPDCARGAQAARAELIRFLPERCRSELGTPEEKGCCESYQSGLQAGEKLCAHESPKNTKTSEASLADFNLKQFRHSAHCSGSRCTQSCDLRNMQNFEYSLEACADAGIERARANCALTPPDELALRAQGSPEKPPLSPGSAEGPPTLSGSSGAAPESER